VAGGGFVDQQQARMKRQCHGDFGDALLSV
jgi:hypothetical protein